MNNLYKPFIYIRNIQTKKTIPGKKILFLMIFLAALILSGCFTPWKEDKTKITIILSGSANPGRAAVYPPDDATLSQLEHIVDLSNPPETITLRAEGGKDIEAVVSPGFWNISVNTFLGENLYASGSATADLQTGQNNVVAVVMYPPYTVTFDVGEGDSEVPAQIVKRGGKVPKPANPKRTKHVFVGWYSDDDTAWNFTTGTVTKNMTLYAKWNELFTVTFDTGDDGSNVPEQIVENGKTIEPEKNPERVKYAFAGWYREPEYTNVWNIDTDTVSEDMTLYAKWNELFTVTFNTGVGGSAVEKQIVEDGYTAEKPQPNPTRPGYLFDGWYQDAGCNDIWNFATPVTEDFTLYAKWLELSSAKITVEFNRIGDETIDLTRDKDGVIYFENTLTVTVTGGYDSYQWYVDGSLQYETSDSITITINWGSFNIGPHFLMAVVIKDDVPYSKGLKFNVAYKE